MLFELSHSEFDGRRLGASASTCGELDRGPFIPIVVRNVHARDPAFNRIASEVRLVGEQYRDKAAASISR
jgi:hypothetical protein